MNDEKEAKKTIEDLKDSFFKRKNLIQQIEKKNSSVNSFKKKK